MKIVSLYKIWRGDEFLIPSIESNYRHVYKMVFVSSDISWSGEHGNNTKEVVLQWKSKNDFLNKIVVIDMDTTRQDIQYNFGIDYINREIPECDWIQVVDSDEVWDDIAWEKSMDYLFFGAHNVNAVNCSMYTYVKKQFYRVIGNGEVCPVVFVRPFVGYQGTRFSLVRPLGSISCRVHHFALVRRDINEIVVKLKNSIIGDNDSSRLCDVDMWIKNVWDNIPIGNVYHYIKGCENIWQGITVVKPECIPFSCVGINI